MQTLYEKVAEFYFAIATLALMLVSFGIFIAAMVTLAGTATAPDPINELLDSIGLLIIGFAIIETSKFIAEEELFSQRELRSPRESRRSLTKFISIIVIVASLEALVMIFKTSRTDISQSIYPAALFIAAMLSLTALGAYQWLSSRIERDPNPPQRPARKKVRKRVKAGRTSAR